MQNLKQDLQDPELGASLPSPKIYDLDAEMCVKKVAKRNGARNPGGLLVANNKIADNS